MLPTLGSVPHRARDRGRRRTAPIELRVVPREAVQSPGKETKLSFDVQICWYQEGDFCAAIPGATVRYFGTALDQPRVILKAFIPWHQLGLTGPPRPADLRLDIGVTAFYRSRWMSRSGLAPEVAMANPAGWLPVRLGGAAPDWPSRRLRRAGSGTLQLNRSLSSGPGGGMGGPGT